MFVTQSEEDYRIKIHHGRSMCEEAQANVEPEGNVECWFAPSSISHQDGDGEGILSHITLMLTQPDTYRDKLVDFFNNSIGQPNAVV